jgi:hypothetical protein
MSLQQFCSFLGELKLQTIPVLPQKKMAIWVVENILISLRIFYKMTQG